MHWKRKVMTGVAMLSFLLTACSGGGGDDSSSTDSSPVSAPGPQSGDTAAPSTQAVLRGFDFGLRVVGGDVSASSSRGSFKTARAKDLGEAVAQFHKAFMAARDNAVTPSETISCPDGGTVVIEQKTEGDGGSNTAIVEQSDGDSTVITTATGSTTTFTGCKQPLNAEGAGEMSLNLTTTVNVERVTMCRGVEVPASFAIETQGTTAMKVDKNANGVSEHGDLDAFRMTITITTLDAVSCVPTDFVASQSGKFSYTDNVEPNNSFTLDIPSSDPVVVTWETVAGGANVTLNGSYTVDSSCFTGALTVETAETLFFPIAENTRVPDCLTSGVINVTGALTQTITFTSAGGVEIDQGSDGTVDETFESCYDADSCG